MEFEELQQIWDTQNHQPLYVLNEKALHNRIVAKKYQVVHIARFTEWMLMIVNTAVGGFILWVSNSKGGIVFMYVLAAWLFGSALYVLVSCIRRRQRQQRFDNTMLGDLQQAVATATYQVRLSLIMRWNALPIGLWILLSFWETHKPIWTTAIIGCFLILVLSAGRWEHNIYKSKKQELETLLKKLQQ